MIGDWTIIDWAIDTFVYTALLIALVLVLRRPVAAHFGPRAAYALWLLPLARFVLPPVTLPAWMRPVAAEPVAPLAVEVAVPVAEMPVADVASAPLISADLLLSAGLAVWLAGAVLFLGWRVACYRATTRHILAAAIPVGDVGPIRLVESAAVAAPVAFGVRDKVIALPPGFMAGADVAARDFAIAHEIAHHRGHDLVANLVAQPLLALHWCSPLGWLGWRAMRRDQEAACDARVMAGQGTAERARYGAVIAACSRERSLAPRNMNLAPMLAAPMAGFREIGPRLGEKAIVHRLRSLSMIPSTRRHRAGLALIGAAGLVALPLTASVSYAEDEVSRTEVPPSDVHEVERHVVVRKHEDGSVEIDSDDDLSAEERAEIEAEIERAEAEIERAEAEWELEIEREVEQAEAAAEKAERAAENVERRIVMLKMPEIDHEVSQDGKVHVIRMAKADTNGKRVVRKLVIDGNCEVGEGGKGDAGDATSRVCTGVPHAMIVGALETARSALANAPDLDAETRAEIMAEFDAEIAELKAERDRS